MTPWAPIAITVLLTFGPALLVWRLTRNGTLAVSTGLLILALASFVLGTIATVAFFWGALLLLGALLGFATAWIGRRRSDSGMADHYSSRRGNLLSAAGQLTADDRSP